jgi:regulator of sirC expression with transglutaminase-like and TPR domain
MSGRAAIEAELTAIGKQDDAEVDIGTTALLLGALDRPDLALDRYRNHLRSLAETAADPVSAGMDVAGQAAALRRSIHERHGYVGDEVTYDDPQNANLLGVIDRRKGLPVALGILYMHAARAQGWSLSGLNFPGHFLLRLEASGERLVLDPFHGGVELSAGEMRAMLKRLSGGDVELQAHHCQAVGCRDVLLRLQNNIKTRALQAKDYDRASQVLRSMLLIAPTHAPSWREFGLIEAERGNLQSALGALQSCIAHTDDDRLRRDVALHLRRLRAKLN